MSVASISGALEHEMFSQEREMPPSMDEHSEGAVDDGHELASFFL